MVQRLCNRREQLSFFFLGLLPGLGRLVAQSELDRHETEVDLVHVLALLVDRRMKGVNDLSPLSPVDDYSSPLEYGQVVRNLWLVDLESLDHVRDAELTFEEKFEDLQTVEIGQSLKRLRALVDK